MFNIPMIQEEIFRPLLTCANFEMLATSNIIGACGNPVKTAFDHLKERPESNLTGLASIDTGAEKSHTLIGELPFPSSHRCQPLVEARIRISWHCPRLARRVGSEFSMFRCHDLHNFPMEIDLFWINGLVSRRSRKFILGTCHQDTNRWDFAMLRCMNLPGRVERQLNTIKILLPSFKPISVH